MLTIVREGDDLFSDNVEDDPQLRNKTGVFKNRTDAGGMLANKLLGYHDKYEEMIIVAVPSGGLPIGYEAAKRLHTTIDIMLVRKIPIPWEPEAGFGSVTFDGSIYLNSPLVRNLGLSEQEINECVKKAKEGLKQRAKKLALEDEGRLLQNVRDRTAVIVDDGLASGFTMLASVASLKKRHPGKILVAVPTGSSTAIELVAPNVDRLLCLNIRSGYSFAVADAYKEWYDVSEEEAADLLMKFRTDGFFKFK